MENTVGQRLKWLLDSRNISSREFQKFVSVGEKQISNWISGTSHIQVKHIIEIASYFKELSMDWFLLGRGDPFSGDRTDISSGQPDVTYNTCKECDKLKIRADLLREECDRKDLIISRLNQELGMYKGNNSIGFRDVTDKDKRQIIGGYGRKNPT